MTLKINYYQIIRGIWSYHDGRICWICPLSVFTQPEEKYVPFSSQMREMTDVRPSDAKQGSSLRFQSSSATNNREEKEADRQFF